MGLTGSRKQFGNEALVPTATAVLRSRRRRWRLAGAKIWNVFADAMWKAAVNINSVDRIVTHVAVQVHATPKPDRILACPPPSRRVVAPRPKPHEPRVRVVEPSGKSKRNLHISCGERSRERVRLIPKLVEVDGLDHVAAVRIDDGPRAPEMIAQDTVRPAR